MADIQELNYDEIISVSNEIKKLAGEIDTMLEQDLKKDKEIVTSPDVWDSDASRKFSAKYDELSKKFAAFYTNIKNMGDFLNTRVQNQEETDSKVEKAVEEYLAD